jgi:DNA invertase Pin-like site-specific DNA recombinase
MTEGSGPAAIYVRISDDPLLTGSGVRRQEKECRELAERLGWPVGKVYEDDDRSAFKVNVKRRQYLSLLADIRAGNVKRLIAWHPDRMHRQPKELEEFIDVVQSRKVAIATVKAGELDLATADGQLRARITGAVAAHESQHKSERVRSKMAELTNAGKWTGGPRPFGWEADGITQRPAEVKLLREAKDRVLAGETIHSICVDWDRRKIRGTRSGGKFIRETSLRRMFLSPRVIGSNGTTKAEWSAIFTAAEYERLRAIVSAKGGLRPARAYMLTGELLKCGLCGGPLYGQPTFGGKPVPYYSCRKQHGMGCGRIAIRVADTDEMVMIRLVDHLQSREFAARLNRMKKDNPGLGPASVEAGKVQARLAELGELYGDGSITKDEWLAAKRKLEPRAKAAEAALEAARAQVAGLEGLRAIEDASAWLDNWHEKLDLDGRRRVVLAMVERVTVQPHQGAYNRPDPDRVEVAFRV